jgi:hypothetical protein
MKFLLYEYTPTRHYRCIPWTFNLEQSVLVLLQFRTVSSSYKSISARQIRHQNKTRVQGCLPLENFDHLCFLVVVDLVVLVVVVVVVVVEQSHTRTNREKKHMANICLARAWKRFLDKNVV